MRTVTVLGAGGWGTALAVHLGRIGHEVRLWARDCALVEDMAARRANAVYLPDVPLPDSVTVTDALEGALADAELVVSAIPSHGCRGVIHHAASLLAPGAVIITHTETPRALRRASPSKWRASCRPRFWQRQTIRPRSSWSSRNFGAPTSGCTAATM